MVVLTCILLLLERAYFYALQLKLLQLWQYTSQTFRDLYYSVAKHIRDQIGLVVMGTMTRLVFLHSYFVVSRGHMRLAILLTPLTTAIIINQWIVQSRSTQVLEILPLIAVENF